MKNNIRQLIDSRVEDLYKSTDFYSVVFLKLTGYAIIAADFDGNIIAFNEGAHQIFGYPPLKVIGKINIETLFANDFGKIDKLQEITCTLLEKGEVSLETDMVRKNKALFPAKIIFALTKNNNSQIKGFIVIAEDLTERKRAEKIEAEALAKTQQIVELERERITELERELSSLEKQSSGDALTVTAQIYSASPMKETQPAIFAQCILDFEKLLDLAIEQRAYRVTHDISGGVRSLAQEMGKIRAMPRDVLDIFTAAMRNKSQELTIQKMQARIQEGRIILLELMGYLVTYYRNYALGSKNIQQDEIK